MQRKTVTEVVLTPEELRAAVCEYVALHTAGEAVVKPENVVFEIEESVGDPSPVEAEICARATDE